MSAWTSTRDKAGQQPQAADGATRLPFFLAAAALVLAFGLAVALRLHGLGQQVLLDDEWEHGIETVIDVTLCGRYYERFADHAVSVARRVAFLVTGERAPAVQEHGLGEYAAR